MAKVITIALIFLFLFLLSSICSNYRIARLYVAKIIKFILLFFLIVAGSIIGYFGISFAAQEYKISKWPDHYQEAARKCSLKSKLFAVLPQPLCYKGSDCCFQSLEHIVAHNDMVMPEGGCPEGYTAGWKMMCRNSLTPCNQNPTKNTTSTESFWGGW